jgi:hypothetical protein
MLVGLGPHFMSSSVHGKGPFKPNNSDPTFDLQLHRFQSQNISVNTFTFKGDGDLNSLQTRAC